MTVDTLHPVATPEGIELALRLAGPVPRALAWSIDFGLRLVVLLALALALGGLKQLGMGLFFIAWFALEWLMPAWCEVSWGGATPGKRALGLMVVHDDGRPVGWSGALTRNLLRAVDMLPFLYGFGLIAMLMSRDFKRIGDLAARTLVIYCEPKSRRFSIPNATPIAPLVPLSAAEQRAVLDFAERMPGFTEERAEELAAIATTASALTQAQAHAPAQHLLAIANHLLGRR